MREHENVESIGKHISLLNPPPIVLSKVDKFLQSVFVKQQ